MVNTGAGGGGHSIGQTGWGGYDSGATGVMLVVGCDIGAAW